LAKAEVMLKNWVVYFNQMHDHMYDTPNGYDASTVAKHEWLLAQDSLHHIEYLSMFARYNRLNGGKQLWYPARASPSNHNGKGYEYGPESSRGMCRRCRVIKGRPGCEEFSRVGGWKYKLEPGEWKHGTDWLWASFDLCVRGGHVWLPKGDTMNCNFYQNDRLQSGWNSWQDRGD